MKIEERFGGERAGKYDEGIRAAVPGYEALHDMARSLLRLDLKEQARLLSGRAPAPRSSAWARRSRSGRSPGWTLPPT